MAYQAHLKRAPTGGNQLAAAQLAPHYAGDALKAIRSAATALNDLSQAGAATPEQTLSAVLAWRAGQVEVARLERQILGCAVLGGAAVSTTASKLGVRSQTLSSWLAGTKASWRGLELERTVDGSWGPVRASELQVHSADAPEGPTSDGRSVSNVDPYLTEYTAGAPVTAPGVHQMPLGTEGVAPPR